MFKNKGSKVAATVSIAVAGIITTVNNFFNTTAEEFSADNDEAIATDDVQTARRSDTELEKFVDNTEDSDSVINVEDIEDEDTKETEEVEEEIVQEEDNKEEVETNVENSQNLAVENNQSSETTATDTSTNTTSSGNNSTPTQRVERATNNSAEAEERAAQEKAQREAEEKAAQERAQREAEEKAAQEQAAREAREAEERRAAEEAERKRAESLKIHSRALFLNGQPVGQNARGDIWFYQGQLSGTVEYQNDSGARRTVSVQSVEVNSNMIGVNDGISYASEASGSISPVVVTQLANGNILLQILR